MNNVHFMSEKSDWETPQELFDKLHQHFHFTLDAAASDHNHKLPRYYTEQTNGLAQDWGGSVSSVILPTVIRKPAYGLENVGKKLTNRIRWWYFLFQLEQTVFPFMSISTTSPVSPSTS